MNRSGVPAHRKGFKNGFRRSDGFRRLKLAFKRLSGREPRLKTEIQVPLERLEDWWVCLDLLAEKRVLYSFGIGEDLGFELEIIRRKSVEVFAFDPTPNTVNWLSHQQFPEATRVQLHFYPWAVSDRDGTDLIYPRIRKDGGESRVMCTMVPGPEPGAEGVEVETRTLGSIMQILGHAHIDVLKLDIEGAEYAVLENMLASSIRPTQILLEFHHRFPHIGNQRTLDAVSALRKAGYALARISSSGREFTLIRKSAD